MPALRLSCAAAFALLCACAPHAPTTSSAPPPRSNAPPGKAAAAPEVETAVANAASAEAIAAEVERAETTIVFIVRHAEKAGESGDVPLSPEGRERAEDLAAVLANVDLDTVHSTATVRTRSTAAPAARAAGLPVELYDHTEPGAMLDELLIEGGTHLVIGHSNTVPDLVRHLGGNPGSEFRHDDYDRLYVLVVPRTGDPTSLRLRYGD